MNQASSSGGTYQDTMHFFPQAKRHDLLKLYNFVRTVDDYVDSPPQQVMELNDLEAKWNHYRDFPMRELTSLAEDDTNTELAKDMCRLAIRYQFNQEWIDAFLLSMRLDTEDVSYRTLANSLTYVYGSAEVIALMVAKILNLPEEVLPHAAAQARALQWLNFLRDIGEDTKLKRQYFPAEDLHQFSLKDLSARTAHAQPQKFESFILFELKRYRTWQREAEKGYKHLPRRLQVAIKMVADGYEWTAQQIEHEPLEIYRRTLRPGKTRLLASIMTHMFD